MEPLSCLRSEEAVCFTRFYLKRKRPGTVESAEQEAFLKVIEYLEENENSYLSIADLQIYMRHRHIQLGGLRRN